MDHRIRLAMKTGSFIKMSGEVEADETFIGGSQSNKHKSKRTVKGGTRGKFVVAGAVERKGNVVARMIAGTDSQALHGFLNAALSDKVSLLCTDQWRGYRGINKKFPHSTVDHSIGQYVVGAVHTQTIEGFWSLIKRGIMGTYHKVSAKYLPLYVAEFEFRYNNRKNQDIFGAAVARC
jgi:IS1 family transposase